jgi:ATP-dependent protease ClpP protease subunit
MKVDVVRAILAFLIAVAVSYASHAQVVQQQPPEPIVSQSMAVIELNESNTLIFDQGIYPEFGIVFTMAAIFQRAALPAEETLYVLIYSPGGRTDIAESLSATLNDMPNTKLVCVRCASAAAWIFEKSDEQRLILPTTEIIMHEIGTFIRPSTIDTFDAAKFKADGEAFNQVFMDRMNMSAEEYHERIDGTDWSVMADEMIKLGLADQIIQVKCDEAISTIMPNTCGVAAE